MSIQEVLAAPRSPWQSPYVERLELAGIPVPAHSKNVSGDDTLANLQAKSQEFSMNPGTSPAEILLGHPFNKLTKLGANPGSALPLPAGGAS
jgi:hypothetical protein